MYLIAPGVTRGLDRSGWVQPQVGGGLGALGLDVGQMIGGVNWQTFALVGAGGLLLYGLFFGGVARARRGEMKAAREEYTRKVRAVRAKYPRYPRV